MENTILHGDCKETLKILPDNCIEAIVTDPPYELGFMGKSWDSTGIANDVSMWKECLRVLKPGGYLLAFSGTRTYHRMASAIEDAGFEVRDMIEWVYGSGFPKSLNINKTINKLQGNEREVVGQSRNGKNSLMGGLSNTETTTIQDVTKGTSVWEGWGTALKPAHEPICMARKPLESKTVAENCLKWGTGGINIDESRVGTSGARFNGRNVDSNIYGKYGIGKPKEDYNMGRFPANLIHDNSEEVMECFLNESARFFKSIIYNAKAGKSERNMGCDELEQKQYSHDGRKTEIENPYQRNKSVSSNNHPTVKPIALMEYLVKMVTRDGQTVLDPFSGSGTTLIACKKNNRKYIGCELDAEYIKIAEARLSVADEAKQTTLL